jgi:hypothetical protein
MYMRLIGCLKGYENTGPGCKLQSLNTFIHSLLYMMAVKNRVNCFEILCTSELLGFYPLGALTE